MPPRPLYSIPESSYLFGRKNTPEEEVRQWALFELLGTYKWPITSLQIELPVQIGTRTFRADIAIFDNSIPLAIVECKRRGYEFGEKDFRQAYSYADSVQARFVILTNGMAWLTSRKIGMDWEPVIEIPKPSQFYLTQTFDGTPSDRLDSLMWSIHGFQTLLYWLYRPIPKEEVMFFAKSLHTFFTYTHFDVNRHLKGTVTLMCAYLSDDNFFQSHLRGSDNGYAVRKLIDVSYDLQEYLEVKGGKSWIEIYDNDMTVQRALKKIVVDLEQLHGSSFGINNAELHISEFIFSLAIYFEKVFESRALVELASQSIQPFWNLVDAEFLPNLGALLPKSHDDNNVNGTRVIGQHIIKNQVVNPFFK